VTGLVSAAGVTEEVVKSVREDIATQLGQPDGTLLTWRSCEEQNGPSTPPSNLPSSSCDRDDPKVRKRQCSQFSTVVSFAVAKTIVFTMTGSEQTGGY
jgi:hypothetical protein